MLKNKGIGLFLASFIFTLALALNSNALTCAFVSPSNSNTLGFGNRINVSFADAGGAIIQINVTASSPSTANSSSSLLFSLNNNTGNAGNNASVNFTIRSLADFAIEPSNDYTLTARCSNSTDSVAGDATRTSITFDRGDAPSAPTSLLPTGRLTTQNNDFSGTVNGANTTSCTLQFEGANPGNSQYAMTHSANSCTLTLNNMPKSTYKFSISASDGTNLSVSAQNVIDIDGTATAGRRAAVLSYIGGGSGQPTQSSVARGLAIASQTPAGERSNGLANAQEKVKQGFKKELTKPELKKTGYGAAIGAGVGAIGLIVPPIAIFSIPAGAAIGAIIGAAV